MTSQATSVTPAVASPLTQLIFDSGDLCRVLSMSPATLHRLRAAGKLPRAHRLGGRLAWRADEVREWVAAGMPNLETWEAMRP
jgi:predicted DNA-binding transcriptional regulator AlpA